MSNRIKEILYIFIIAVLSFGVSFVKFNGMYFSFCIPILALTGVHKLTYFISACFGMFAATIFMDFNSSLIMVLTTFLITAIFAICTSKTKISNKLATYIASISAFFAFVLSWASYLGPIESNLFNVILLPFLYYFICYHLVDLEFSIKSMEYFSITKNQLAFIIVFINLLLCSLNITAIDFEIGLTITMMLSYIFIRMDSTLGLFVFATSFIFYAQYDYNLAMLFLFPMVFAIRPLSINRHFGIMAYLALNVLFSIYLDNFSYAFEFLLVAVFMLCLPEKAINKLQQYVVEPEEHELKMCQKSYYRCLSNNRKVKSIMDLLEIKLLSSTRIRNSVRETILKNLQFLSDKLNQEEDIYLKQHIVDELSYRNLDVLALKVKCDYLNHYQIHLEFRNGAIKDEQLSEILSTKIGTRLKKIDYQYNYLTKSHKYIFINDERYIFNVSIKQRSKNSRLCGDSYLSFSIKNKKYVLISDGMGHGNRASIDSSASLLMLKNFIELGMDPKEAIISCNSLMFDKDKETFNTLDLLEYDTFDDALSLYKNGSGVTYVKKQDEVEKIDSENLPLGIIEKIDVEKLNLGLNLDYIILTSDGLKKDYTQLLKDTKSKCARSLSDEILDYEGKGIDDDQTIVVINVIKK